ncbi:MAG: Hsp20 family protein [bacterium]|nr:Hsp20 family protein [bacterium]
MENKWRKIVNVLGIVILTFVTAFFAFYLAICFAYNQLFNPTNQIKRIDKMLQIQDREFKKFDNSISKHPFLRYSTTPFVSISKEPDSYKVVVDLKPLNDNSDAIKVDVKGNSLSIRGNSTNNSKNKTSEIDFSQVYYLDEELNADMIKTEKDGHQYIVTIPFMTELSK